ncbi:MAG: ABC transporter permease [Chloroflexota bacterium]|nr:ABC transporter permease [Chloroflexota bacterium]
MSLAKTYAVMMKETRHILRDRTTFLLLLLIPVILMIIFAYALAVDIKEVPITLLNYDRGVYSRDYVTMLSNSQDLVVGQPAESYAQIEDWFDRSLVKAVIVIPPEFSESLQAGRPTDIQLLVDGTDPATAEFAMNHILSRSMVFGYDVAIEILSRQAGTGALAAIKEPIDLRVRTWYNPNLSNQVGIVPALLALVLNLPALAVMTSLVREKELGTLEAIFATPLSRGELLVGKIIPYVFFSLISAILCAAAAVSIFDVPFRGSFPLFLFMTTIFFLAAFSMALLISIFLPTQAAAAIGGLLIFIFPAFFLSGIFFPVSAFPDMVRMEASFIPSTPFVAIVRGLMIKGQGLDALWPQAALMLGVFVVMTLFSILLFKKKIG